MSPALLIGTYGYAAILLGTAIEGETVLIAAGFLAHRGYLELKWVLLMAFLGSLAADQLFFCLGRWKGPSFLEKRPTWQPRAQRVQRLLNRHTTALAVGFRFLYGLRTVVPFAIGMSGIETGKFLLLNASGALIWVAVMGGAGYAFGQILEALLGDLKKYELPVVLAIVLFGAAVWLFLRKRPALKGIDA